MKRNPTWKARSVKKPRTEAAVPSLGSATRFHSPNIPIGQIGGNNSFQKLLICQPIAATLLAHFPLKQLVSLRRISQCWRDAVNSHLKSLKQLNACELLKQPLSYDAERKGKDLLEFFSRKAPGIESLTLRHLLSAFPAVLDRFGKLKHLDINSAGLNCKLLDVLEKQEILSSLESLSFPSWERFAKESIYKERLQLLFGHFSSLKSLTLTMWSSNNCAQVPLLENLTAPEKLTYLSMKTVLITPIKSLPRFNNLEHLQLSMYTDSNYIQKNLPILESALKQLTGLKRLNLDLSRVSSACIQILSELPCLERLATSCHQLPEGNFWGKFPCLSCLELEYIGESFIGCINLITTLRCLQLGANGKVKFNCSLPQLDTLCLEIGGSPFQFDFHPVCCNLRNLTIRASYYDLNNMTKGLLQRNPNIRKLRIGWALNQKSGVLGKAKSIAKLCQNLEILEFSMRNAWSEEVKEQSVEALPMVASLFLDLCPQLKQLRTTPRGIDALKSLKAFEYLKVSLCSSGEDSWLFS